MPTLSITAELEYRLAAPCDAILVLEAAAVAGQRILGAHIDIPGAVHFARVTAETGVGERLMLRLNERLHCRYRAEVEVTRPVTDLAGLAAVPVHLLPSAVVPFLMASRFCPSDRLQNFVAAEFGGLDGGAAVAAMAEWVRDRIAYVPGESGPHTSALDTFVHRQGVCRDFAHLTVSFARAAGIPARMASVYAPEVAPQDFHAVAEVFLAGAWVPVDATGMASADAMAVICVGRDAADIAFLSAFGQASLVRQAVTVVRTA